MTFPTSSFGCTHSGGYGEELHRDLESIHQSYVAGGGASRSIVGLHRIARPVRNMKLFSTQPVAN
eukprot:1268257-Amphidinium_carterae.1